MLRPTRVNVSKPSGLTVPVSVDMCFRGFMPVCLASVPEADRPQVPHMSREPKLDMRQGLLSLAATSVLLACDSDAGERLAPATLIGRTLGVPAGPIEVVARPGI